MDELTTKISTLHRALLAPVCPVGIMMGIVQEIRLINGSHAEFRATNTSRKSLKTRDTFSIAVSVVSRHWRDEDWILWNK